MIAYITEHFSHFICFRLSTEKVKQSLNTQYQFEMRPHLTLQVCQLTSLNSGG